MEVTPRCALNAASESLHIALEHFDSAGVVLPILEALSFDVIIFLAEHHSPVPVTPPSAQLSPVSVLIPYSLSQVFPFPKFERELAEEGTSA